MTIVAAPSRSALTYRLGELSARRLFALIDYHNTLIGDIHDAMGLADADSGITDTDYEAELTAAQINYSGFTPTESTPTPIVGQFGQFTPLAVTEELARLFHAELIKQFTDIDAIIAKLAADAGITATNFSTSRYRATRLIQRATLEQNLDQIDAALMLTDRWNYGTLLVTGIADSGEDVNVLVSRDDGYSWSVLSTFPTTVSHVRGLFQFGHRVIALATTSSALALYESTDFGRSWTDVSSRLPASGITSTSWRRGIKTAAGTLLAAGNAGGEVLRSTDGGVTWSEVNVTGPTGNTAIGEFAAAGKVAYGGDDGILYTSSDDGVSFSAEEDFSAGNDHVNGILELSNGYWLVTTQDAAGVDELHVSQDAGATWETPVAVTGAQDELGIMVQGPDAIVYLAVGANIQVSDDLGATVEAAADGIDLPANDTGVTAFFKNRHGEVFCGTLNTTDFGGLFKIGVQDNEGMDAFGDDVTGEHGPLGPQHGEGADGRWLDWVHEQLIRLGERWQALGAFMDDDGDINTTTYEAQFAAAFPTPHRTLPPRDLHNSSHGAGA